jgi:fibronectin type 3 domain-containing protein
VPKLTTAEKNGKSSITIRWDKVPGAAKYRVYKYVNGKLRLVTGTTKTAVKITGTKSGRKYTYAVKAFVNGKWTTVTKDDLKSIVSK